MPSSQAFRDEKVRGIMNNTPSSQALMAQTDSYKQMHPSDSESGLATPVFVTSSSGKVDKKTDVSARHSTRSQWFAMAILTFINLINYMDRYTIAGKKPLKSQLGALARLAVRGHTLPLIKF